MKAQIQNYKLITLNLLLKRSIATKKLQEKLEDSYKTLEIPIYSKQDVVRQAFLDLAKKYHPDSCSSEADIEKFVAVENAFRVISKYNTGSSNSEEVKKIVINIQHTAPQHRQYLSFEGKGHGTPYQRQKQWEQARAQKAASNVMEHRISKAIASDKTLMKKGAMKKHDIKTKYGFDRLVEDLIQESISKGEFDNLSGKGKPLKDQNRNPYVDFTTHKLNEVLINNGFTPEWITMNKEIEQDIESLMEEIKKDRMYLGPYPLIASDCVKWKTIYDSNKDLANSINIKINTYNLIVPLLNKQRLHVDFDKICNDILINGIHSVTVAKNIKEIPKPEQPAVTEGDDIIGVIFKAIGDLFTLRDKKKDIN